MFNLTKEIKLSGKSLKTYRWLQGMVYVLAGVAFLGVIFMVLFPSYSFSFNFSTPDSKKNSITNLQKEDGNFISQGKVLAEKNNSFYVSWFGNFSKIKVAFELNKKDKNFQSGKIRVQKGFAAFFSPKGLPRSFNDGSLIKSNGEYFIVSDKALRKFENLATLESFGFNPDIFLEVSPEDLRFNLTGDLIRFGDDTYPNATLINVNSDYYIYNGGKMDKFISENAFLSNFSKEQAIVKDEAFLAKKSISSRLIGFADGTLIAYGDSAFVVEGKFILPIESAETFQAFGFDWNDLVSVNGDEFSFYQKGDLFKIDNVHPNNSLFQVSENGQLYLYEDGSLHFLSSEKAAKSWSKKKPVIVSEKNITQSAQCGLVKSGIIFTKYVCEAKINNLAEIPGKDYQVKFSFSKDTNIYIIETTLSKDLNWKNIRYSIGEILRKIKLTYVKEN